MDQAFHNLASQFCIIFSPDGCNSAHIVSSVLLPNKHYPVCITPRAKRPAVCVSTKQQLDGNPQTPASKAGGPLRRDRVSWIPRLYRQPCQPSNWLRTPWPPLFSTWV